MADDDSGCGAVIGVLALVVFGVWAVFSISYYSFIFLSGVIGHPLLLAMGMVTLGALAGLLKHIRKHGTSDAGSADNYATIMGFRLVPEKWALLVLSIVLVLLGIFRWIWFPTTTPRNKQQATTTAPPSPISWVNIPAGKFQMGCVPTDNSCNTALAPRHQVTLGRFMMMNNLTTVAQYRSYSQATHNTMQSQPDWSSENHPVVNVNWDEGKSFCEWSGGRLPTNAEWEYAARGGKDGTIYPWGNEASHEYANYGNDNDDHTTGKASGRDQWVQSSPVGSFPANGFGLYDMTGNVWEWVADYYEADYYANSSSTDPKGPASGTNHVTRGGSWNMGSENIKITTFLTDPPGDRSSILGFRCVRTADVMQREATNKADLTTAAKLVIGSWRWENQEATYLPDGTNRVLMDNGRQITATWSINGDVLTLVNIEADGQPIANQHADRFRIVSISSSRFVVTEMSSGKTWRATRSVGATVPKLRLTGSPERNSAFIDAAFNCDERAASVLLSQGVDLNTTDYNSRTALMIAARKGCTAFVKLLLKHNVDVNYKNSWDMTALDWARNENKADVVKLLTENGAK